MPLDPNKIETLFQQGKISQQKRDELLGQVPSSPVENLRTLGPTTEPNPAQTDLPVDLQTQTANTTPTLQQQPDVYEPDPLINTDYVRKSFDFALATNPFTGPARQVYEDASSLVEGRERENIVSKRTEELVDEIFPPVGQKDIESQREQTQFYSANRDESTSQTAQQQPQMPKMTDFMPSTEGLERAAERRKEATLRQSEIREAGLAGAADVYEQTARELFNAQENVDKIRQQYKNEIEKDINALEELRNTDIKPQNFWAKNNIASSIGLIIGAGLQGFAKGFSGRGPDPMATINNLINNDLQAQKANLAKNINVQKGVLAETRRKFADEMMAEKAARITMLDRVKARLNAVEKGALSQEQREAAKQMNAKLDMEIEQTKLALEERAAQIHGRRLGALAEQMQQQAQLERLGPVERAIMKTYPEKDQRKRARDQVEAVRGFDSAIKEFNMLKEKIQQIDDLDTLIPGTDKAKQMQVILNQLEFLGMKSLQSRVQGGGKIVDSERERKRLRDLIPKLRDIPLNRIDVVLDEFEAWLQGNEPPAPLLKDAGIDPYLGYKENIKEMENIEPRLEAEPSPRAEILMNRSAVPSKQKEQIKQSIASASETFGVPQDLLFAIAKTESNFNPNAKSKLSSAKGLFQFTDQTARQYGIEDPMNPDESARAAAKYLKTLYNRYNDWGYAVQAYHHGAKAVDYLAKQGKREFNDAQEAQLAVPEWDLKTASRVAEKSKTYAPRVMRLAGMKING